MYFLCYVYKKGLPRRLEFWALLYLFIFFLETSTNTGLRHSFFLLGLCSFFKETKSCVIMLSFFFDIQSLFDCLLVVDSSSA